MKNIKIIISFILLASISAFAQFGSTGALDARSMSMAKTSNAISQGVFSIGINPSNLLNSSDVVNFSTVLPIPNISVRAGTNFISINDINYFFGGVNGSSRVLTDDDKQRLNSLFSNGGLVLGNVSLNLFSFGLKLDPSIGAFGLSINDVVESNVTIPSELSQFALSGNPAGSNYNFDDTKFNAWWIRDYSLSYAREFPEIPQDIFTKLAAGITFKYVQGFAYAQSSQVNGNYIKTDSTNNQITVSTNYSIQSAFSDNFGVKYSYNTDTTKNSNFSPFPSPAGTGLGFDIGLSASIEDTWKFAAAVTDIGSITWDKNAAITTSTGQYTISDLTNQDQRDSIKTKFKGQSDSVSSFTTNLPTALRLGAAYKFNFGESSFPGTLLLALDINQGFNDQPGNSTKTRVSIGAEWKPMNWIPYLRTGFSFGGLFGFHWAAGIGINAGALEFNLGTSDLQTFVAPNSGKYISVAFDSRWKF
ncbi:MAG: DUF5723 family protein [Bacteroidetes bacterium]|nr:DUF5723 family protein [Bacteroidota bacterium]